MIPPGDIEKNEPHAMGTSLIGSDAQLFQTSGIAIFLGLVPQNQVLVEARVERLGTESIVFPLSRLE